MKEDGHKVYGEYQFFRQCTDCKKAAYHITPPCPNCGSTEISEKFVGRKVYWRPDPMSWWQHLVRHLGFDDMYDQFMGVEERD